jgi:hypothetical protein
VAKAYHVVIALPLKAEFFRQRNTDRHNGADLVRGDQTETISSKRNGNFLSFLHVNIETYECPFIKSLVEILKLDPKAFVHGQYSLIKNLPPRFEQRI